jgi:hypothetical protein
MFVTDNLSNIYSTRFFLFVCKTLQLTCFSCCLICDVKP